METLKNWLKKNFEVSNVSGAEYHFPCPICEHPNFYFNIRKKRGYCHRASCHFKPDLETLIDIVGYSPEEWQPDNDEVEVDRPQKDVTLPRDAQPVDRDPEAIMALRKRNIDTAKAITFNLHSTASKIIIPVYDGFKLVQYVGRNINRGHPPVSNKFWSDVAIRYTYAHGAKITDFLYDFHNNDDQCLTIVENTFNAIWLRWCYNTTSTFGSHLSAKQIQLIVGAKRIKSVVILWDEGADTDSALFALNGMGIRASSVRIKGQPDDHEYSIIQGAVGRAHERNLRR